MKKLVFITITISIISCNSEKNKYQRTADAVKESIETKLKEVDKINDIYLSVRNVRDTANVRHYRVDVLALFKRKDDEKGVYEQTYYIDTSALNLPFAYTIYDDFMGHIYGFLDYDDWKSKKQHSFKMSEYGSETFKRNKKGLLHYSY